MSMRLLRPCDTQDLYGPVPWARESADSWASSRWPRGARVSLLLRRRPGVLAVVAAIAGAPAVSGALLAQRRADRDDPLDVLRAGA